MPLLQIFTSGNYRGIKFLSEVTKEKTLGTIFYSMTQMIAINSFHIFMSFRKSLTFLTKNQKLSTLSLNHSLKLS